MLPIFAFLLVLTFLSDFSSRYHSRFMFSWPIRCSVIIFLRHAALFFPIQTLLVQFVFTPEAPYFSSTSNLTFIFSSHTTLNASLLANLFSLSSLPTLIQQASLPPRLSLQLFHSLYHLLLSISHLTFHLHRPVSFHPYFYPTELHIQQLLLPLFSPTSILSPFPHCLPQPPGTLTRNLYLALS